MNRRQMIPLFPIADDDTEVMEQTTVGPPMAHRLPAPAFVEPVIVVVTVPSGHDVPDALSHFEDEPTRPVRVRSQRGKVIR